MKYFKRILIILHLFVGVGAMAGGFSAISNPQSPMGISTEILKNSPFPDFLIPGLLLFGVIGVGNIICAGFAIKGPWYYPYISGVFGGALMVWIIGFRLRSGGEPCAGGGAWCSARGAGARGAE
jgi:hypothetical protein